MSGHSKWATIKRQKGVTDAKRGQAFTKLSNAITIAVKQGGGIGDPDSNFKLRLAVDRARTANMPKENIQRAIDRAAGAGAAAVEELVYEGFAPGGVAVIIETVTDNKQRTFSVVKNTFEKNGGTLGSAGSVSYLFNRVGEIVIKKNNTDSEELLNVGIDAGVDDYEEESDSIFFYVDPSSLQGVKKAFEDKGFSIESAELVYRPLNYISVEPEVQEKILNIIERVEELDDVQQTFSNLG